MRFYESTRKVILRHDMNVTWRRDNSLQAPVHVTDYIILYITLGFDFTRNLWRDYSIILLNFAHFQNFSGSSSVSHLKRQLGVTHKAAQISQNTINECQQGQEGDEIGRDVEYQGHS